MLARRDGKTHRSDPASGRDSRNGSARLPQSVSEHYRMEGPEKWERWGRVEVGGREERRGEEIEGEERQ